MRLHHLTVTAFGPFAGTVEVDFDELSAGGLFLLAGATGAGKTSILDAVCFGLYGQVPGDRAGAKHLRSDHAPPGRAPEVVLRLSIGERELQFTRSPAWSRPKLRGRGETKVQAHVLVEERRGGAWTVLTNRLDDAGLLVSELLGMSSAQFTQVAMLPQGRFQAFLRATSAERHAVLQQLFRTDRFERVEQWLVARRADTRRAAEAGSGRALETVNRLVEATGQPEPPAWLEDLVRAADAGLIEAWADGALAEAETQAASASSEAVRAVGAAQAAERDLSLARAEQALRDRAAAARADLATLDQRSDELAEAGRRLEAHARAVPLHPLAAEQIKARRDVDRTASVVVHAVRKLSPPLSTDAARDDLAGRQRAAQDAVALAAGFGPRASARADLVARQRRLTADLQSVEAGVAEIEVALGDLPGVITDAVAAVHEARAAAGRLPLVLARVERLEGLVTAGRRADVLQQEVVVARADVLTARDRAHDAKERYLDLREARINGMAAELAAQLAVGGSCPVCGSAEHPSPARSGSHAVGRNDEDAARKAHEDAEFDLQARQVGLATLETELAGVCAVLAGTDRDALVHELDQDRDEVARLEPLVAAVDVLTAREQDYRARLHAAEQQRSAALLERAGLQVELDQTRIALAAAEDEWSALLTVPGAAPGESDVSGIDDLLRLRRAHARGLEEVLEQYDDWAQAEDRAAQIAAALEEGARGAGFGSVGAALGAMLGDPEAELLRADRTEADLLRRAAELTLADPAVARAEAADRPDAAAVEAAYEAAATASSTATSRRDAAQARAARVGTLGSVLDQRLASWAPLREQHQQVAELASLVEGKSVDNPLRMRLAAFVLSERLRQVVAAANERLAVMSDQRYALEHSDDRGYGEQRGGLSLRVRDDWSGVLRDPATLSGGETFVVSLALALGLADTVAHEAGGTDIDTLFIDEGFGSLDADTLEDVMDTLDSLRDGGRVVGLVSHVPELRSRITTQLEITKGRSGSSVVMTVGGSG